MEDTNMKTKIEVQFMNKDVNVSDIEKLVKEDIKANGIKLNTLETLEVYYVWNMILYLTQLSDKKLFSIIFRFRIDCKYLKIRDGVFRIHSKCKCSTPGIRKNVVHLPPCIWSYS